MPYFFDPHQPIYLQLLQEFRKKIAIGEWPAGAKFDSVRNLAMSYEVNPNTVQRALTELEREGLSYSERTSGRFVTDDEREIKNLRKQLIEAEANNFIEQAKDLQMDFTEITVILQEIWLKSERPFGRLNIEKIQTVEGGEKKEYE